MKAKDTPPKKQKSEQEAEDVADVTAGKEMLQEPIGASEQVQKESEMPDEVKGMPTFLAYMRPGFWD